MVSATNGLYWGFHNIKYRRHGLSRLYDNGFFSEDLDYFFYKFRVLAAPQFWRVNSCQKIAAYTRANTVFGPKRDEVIYWIMTSAIICTFLQMLLG
jgi:hypothetical protein